MEEEYKLTWSDILDSLIERYGYTEQEILDALSYNCVEDTLIDQIEYLKTVSRSDES